LLLKEEIIDLNHGLDEIYANQLKLKSAKEIMIIDRYNKSPGQCQVPEQNEHGYFTSVVRICYFAYSTNFQSGITARTTSK